MNNNVDVFICVLVISTYILWDISYRLWSFFTGLFILWVAAVVLCILNTSFLIFLLQTLFPYCLPFNFLHYILKRKILSIHIDQFYHIFHNLTFSTWVGLCVCAYMYVYVYYMRNNCFLVTIPYGNLKKF